MKVEKNMEPRKHFSFTCIFLEKKFFLVVEVKIIILAPHEFYMKSPEDLPCYSSFCKKLGFAPNVHYTRAQRKEGRNHLNCTRFEYAHFFSIRKPLVRINFVTQKKRNYCRIIRLNCKKFE